MSGSRTSGSGGWPPAARSGAPLLAAALLAGALGVLCALAGAGCAGRPRPLPAEEAPPAPLAQVGSGPIWPELDRRPPPFLPGAPPSAAPRLVRVGLISDRRATRLTARGEALLSTDAGAVRLARLSAGQTVSLAAERGRVRWSAGEAGGTAPAVLLEPIDPDDLLAWEDADYRGLLLAVPAAGGLTVVNLLDIETYLRGVVPWEIGRPGPGGRAALEAQAVAARTYTAAHLGSRAAQGFDVWADERDQVYRGATGEDSLCNAAIASTVGLVLRHDGREIEAFYSACCGGHGSTIEQVWPREPRAYLRGRPDTPAGGGAPFCSGSASYRWETSWSAAELERILARTLPAYLDYAAAPARRGWAGKVFQPRGAGAEPRRPGRLLGLRIASRSGCGRCDRLEIVTEAGVYQVRGDRLRWVLPPASGRPAILWSARCELIVTPGDDGRPRRVTARGTGFGHGIGLCQDGAVARARRGQSAEEILAHYYPGARLEQLAAGGRAGGTAASGETP